MAGVLAAGCDAGIHYDERLTKNMVRVPIGPATQRFATAASPAYLADHGHPQHPNDLLGHPCLPGRFGSGALATWEFEHDGDIVRIEPTGPLVVDVNSINLAVSAAIDGCGVVQLFEDWLRRAGDSGALEPVLKPWWQSLGGRSSTIMGGNTGLPRAKRSTATCRSIGGKRLPKLDPR